MASSPREVVFHQSANRPTLLLGGDRELVLFSIAIPVLIFFALMSVLGLCLGLGFWIAAIAVLSRMGKADPMLRHVYLRHIRYRPYYGAQSFRGSPTQFIPVNWR
jgi:type IV secretory pathway TrbD component